jgi:RES domain-containing protein
MQRERLDTADITGWNEPDYVASRRAGDEWFDRAEAAVLWVPSVLSPHEFNVLFNQTHPDFGRIVVSTPMPARFDPRLWPRRS